MCWTVRRTGFSLAGTLLLVATAALAQQVDPPPPAPPPLVRTAPDASVYPQNLLHTLEKIEEIYVRPIARVDLLVAAMSGLYEVAGDSVPASLRSDATKAVETKQELRLLERIRKRPEIARRVNDDEALLASCRAMLRLLDPYCEILVGDEARRGGGRMDNFGTGIDLEANGAEGPPRIKDVIPGSPAQKAGLRPGDRITRIDGRTLTKVAAFQATLLLNGGESRTPDLDIPLPSKVQVGIERDNQALHEITLERRHFHAETVFGVQRCDDNSWDFWIDRERKMAQVRIGPLRDETCDDLRQILSHLREDGVRGVLLDLRWCPGGLLNQSRDVAGLFLERDVIYSLQVRGKAGHDPAAVHHPNEENGPFRSVPMIVMVNGETSGGGEIIAAALQDYRRAAIAGQRTRGKGSVQVMPPLPVNGTFLKITAFSLLRPSGKNLNRFPDSKPSDDWGVRPDDGLDFRVSAALSQQLREWWAAQTLRPGGSRERLPLDDPSADPQRQVALQALRERIK